MARNARYLLPRPAVLKELSDEKLKSLVEFSAAQSRESTAYAMVGMLCGTVSFLSSLVAYVCLVKGNHEVAAGVVLGTSVLGIIGSMIRSRTN
jgi:hypothetical protein